VQTPEETHLASDEEEVQWLSQATPLDVRQQQRVKCRGG